VASEAEGSKSAKYSELSVAYSFVPIAVETFGAWGPEAMAFISEFGRRIIVVATGVPCSTVYYSCAKESMWPCSEVMLHR